MGESDSLAIQSSFDGSDPSPWRSLTQSDTWTRPFTNKIHGPLTQFHNKNFP